MSNESNPVQPKHQHVPWKTLIFSATMIAMAAFAYHAYCKSIQAIASSAEKFKTGTITHTFVEHIPDVSPTHGDVLELATSQSVEEFSRSDSRKIAWDWIYLGTTVSTIRVPATFRYHLRLSDPWRLAAKDRVCKVLAPEIRPSLPTAIHTDQMEKHTENGWALFNKDDQLAELERGITPELDKRSGDAAHLKLVREACRQSVGDFVRKWLMKEEQWRSDRFTSIIVVFPDECEAGSDQELEQFRYEPTVKLD